MRAAAAFAFLALATVSLPAAASGAPPAATAPVAAPPATPPSPTDRQPTVAWNPAWAKFRTVQYFTTAALVIADVAIVLAVPDPDPRWDGSLPFDGAAGTALRAGSGKSRERAQYWSDRIHEANFVIGISEAPIAAAAHGAWDVAFQLSLINAQSYALAGLVQLGSARLVGRVRPFVERCKAAGESGEGEDFPCKSGGTTLSFISGHAMTSFVSAGLVCAHHSRLPLYGGGFGDAAACITMVLSATATGTLRVVADKHYFSDVLLGSILGFAFGYGVPKLLHYGNFNELKPDKTARTRTFFPLAPLPYVGVDRAGVSWTALF